MPIDAEAAHKLKALQGRRNRLLASLRIQHTPELAVELERVTRKIDRLQSGVPVVSEHALLRYLERVKHVDLDAATREILTPERVAMIKSVPNCNIKVAGVVFVVRNGVVVTAKV